MKKANQDFWKFRLASLSGLALSMTAVAQAQLLPYTPQDVRLELIQAPSATQILPGLKTNGLSYTGIEESEPTGNVVPIKGSYLGPTIRAYKGQQLTVAFQNNIGYPSITHWHGLDVPANMDGHPDDAINDGETFKYSFEILNRAGTYWYHPHPDMETATQVNAGLAGFLIVHDKEEHGLNLPSGRFDVPLCIQDATFDSSNQRVYNPMMIPGFFGTRVMVNGFPNYVHSVSKSAYRLRLLNGSVSRIYKLAFSDGTPMIAIGTDGGLLDRPRTYPYIMLAPGERVELWADFRNKTIGSQITLRSLSFTSNGGQGAAVNIMNFSVDKTATERKSLPSKLTTIVPYHLANAVNAGNPKTYAIGAVGVNPNMQYTLNGGLFNAASIAENEVATAGSLELIQVTNTSGMPIIPHPIHFHGRQFQMLDRTVLPANQTNWNSVKDGFIMHGWKDTFLIMPGETVRFLVQHGNHFGKFLYHCHNLEHEDMGMMRNFQIVP
jgi:FtsP/CotA-like multicopper oxidase with cupredoxin domain